jgi:hypothetical protein
MRYGITPLALPALGSQPEGLRDREAIEHVGQAVPMP